MRHPVKQVFITQDFGANPANYAKFGFRGHNGLDYRAFNPDGNRCYTGGKSEIFAPHSGKIIENAFDADGYGWYVKIENAVEGSVLGHFSEQCGKKVGEEVNEGDLLAYQGTTGNSTAIHLHWGYYRHPRDRQNGYGGMIDQKPFLIEPVQPEPQEDPRIIELQKEIDEKNKHIGNLEGQVKGLIQANAALSGDLGVKTSDLKDALESAKTAKKALADELNDQLDWAKVAEDEQEKHKITRDRLGDLIFECEEELKLSHGSDDVDTKISKVLGALHSQLESKVVHLSVKDYHLLLVIGGHIWLKS